MPHTHNKTRHDASRRVRTWSKWFVASTTMKVHPDTPLPTALKLVGPQGTRRTDGRTDIGTGTDTQTHRQTDRQKTDRHRHRDRHRHKHKHAPAQTQTQTQAPTDGWIWAQGRKDCSTRLSKPVSKWGQLSPPQSANQGRFPHTPQTMQNLYMWRAQFRVTEAH